MAGHAFFQPYSVDKLVRAPYQLIASGLKKLSREAVEHGSLVVFESTPSSSIGAGSLSSLVAAVMSPSPRNNVEK